MQLTTKSLGEPPKMEFTDFKKPTRDRAFDPRDVNEDGVIDLKDFAEWKGNVGATEGSSAMPLVLAASENGYSEDHNSAQKILIKHVVLTRSDMDQKYPSYFNFSSILVTVIGLFVAYWLCRMLIRRRKVISFVEEHGY